MRVRAALLLVLLGLAAPTAAEAREYRIVGGEPATTTALPFTVGLDLQLRDGKRAVCAGSLIAARWVLTAAHCLVEDPIDPARSTVVIGATNLDAATADQRYGFAEHRALKQYATGNGGYDVGLVKLDRPASARQVRLARPKADAGLLRAGRAAITAGWGLTEDKLDGGRLSTDQLRRVALTLYSDSQCANGFAAAGQPASGLDFTTEICALAPNRDACNGDSGGPLVVTDAVGQPVLIGAVSFGIPGSPEAGVDRSCNEGPPGVYARVGANPLNDLVRAVVPQVEIDANVSVPVPGETVTLTARPRAPGQTGPFGGYDALVWDVDGDGTFTEALGERKVRVPAAPRGARIVSVRATTTAGDAETRTVVLVSKTRSAVSFARASAKVRRGRSVRLKVNRIGSGAGAFRVRVSGRGVTATTRKVRVRGTEASLRIRVRARRGASKRVTVRLRSFSGDVVGGTRRKLSLRVRG